MSSFLNQLQPKVPKKSSEDRSTDVVITPTYPCLFAHTFTSVSQALIISLSPQHQEPLALLTPFGIFLRLYSVQYFPRSYSVRYFPRHTPFGIFLRGPLTPFDIFLRGPLTPFGIFYVCQTPSDFTSLSPSSFCIYLVHFSHGRWR